MIQKNANLSIKRIPIEKIYHVGIDCLNFQRLEEYCNEIKNRPDQETNPIIVVPMPDDRYKVYDGRHRYFANWMSKQKEIYCIVIDNQKEL